ncbi:hypothetical protein H311_00978 [Anncaliia algerae PRA109]|nr:hypothetical protein H311_00978 [Anncaliia algerae PRA109]
MNKTKKNYKVRLTLFSEIFTNNESAFNFALNNQLFIKEIDCLACKKAKMNSRKYSKALNGASYRCINKTCRKRKIISQGCVFSDLKIHCHTVLKAIYCFIMRFNNF